MRSPVLNFAIFLCVAAAASGLSLERSAYDPKYLPLTQPEVLEKYAEYATAIVENQPFSQHDLLVLNQFGVGQTLAVVNENVVLNVSSSGIEDVLKIGCHKITAAYRSLIRKLTDDPNTRISSTIYTQEPDVVLSPGLGKLITFVNLVDMTKDMKAYVDFINAEIQRKSAIKMPVPFFQTEGLSRQQLAGEYLVNIFEYQNSWSKPWTLLQEPANFFSLNKTEIVQFMLTEGFYEVVEKDSYVLVRITLVGGRKNLVLVKSNIHYVEILKSGHVPEEWSDLIDKLWNDFVAVRGRVQDGEWTRKFTNIQIPILKQYVGSPIIPRLKEMGLNKTLCPTPEATAGARTNFMEQFGQLNYVEFNTEKLVVQSITGTKNIGSNKQAQESRRRRSPEDDAAEMASTNGGASKQIPVGEPIEAFMAVFDQPFYWSLEDVNVGPVVTGGVLFPSSSDDSDSGNLVLAQDFMKQFLLCKN